MFLYLLLLSFPLLIHGVIQNCNQINVYSDSTYEGSSSSLSATITLSKDERTNRTKLTLSNISYNSTDSNRPQRYCLNADRFQCIHNNEILMTSGDPSFSLYAEMTTGWYFVYFGYADDNTFSAPNGTLFIPENPTYTTFRGSMHGSTSTSQTCVSFTPAPMNPTPSATKCTKLSSKTYIFNTNKNNTVYASIDMSYSLSSGYLILNGSARIPSNYVLFFSMNDGINEISTDRRFNGYFQIESGIEKFVFFGNLGKWKTATTFDGQGIPMVARIILRDGQTLMREGTPFTLSNKCESFDSEFSDNQHVQSQICCEQFAN